MTGRFLLNACAAAKGAAQALEESCAAGRMKRVGGSMGQNK